MKWLLTLLAAGLLAPLAEAQRTVADSLYRAGNEAYRQNEFQQARAAYRAILDSTALESAALHYNLGNAYYQTGQLGRAILHYRRSLALQPGREAVAHNLAMARERRVDTFESLPPNLFEGAYRALMRWLRPATWAYLALLGTLLLGLGLGFYFYSRWLRPGFIAASAGLLLSLGGLGMVYASENFRQTHQPAVVLSASSYAKAGPSEDAPDAFVLHEGSEVIVLNRLDAWRKVRLPDGKVGWLRREDLGLVEQAQEMP
ncbi:MAG: tetratricopeptide repeat protein [Schleiferiaceae bacterium]|nr:tetratricopeptide repeat protein [Schleiferiaceae bacterium]MDR9443057.1 tetratricopeptide repeat protein [Schleiferiaceae bacterium]